tara:strand:+ start:312 stop:530 length:219 start_codon:yes stop_codon:yes gene_type:complete
MTYLENSNFVELYSDLAEAILLEHHQGKIQINQIEANGDERYTDEAQELFDGYCSLVLEVLEKNGVKQRLTA